MVFVREVVQLECFADASACGYEKVVSPMLFSTLYCESTTEQRRVSRYLHATHYALCACKIIIMSVMGASQS